jgi:hypothetical protein
MANMNSCTETQKRILAGKLNGSVTCECGEIMQSQGVDRLSDPGRNQRWVCQNEACEFYGLRFNVPTVILVESED